MERGTAGTTSGHPVGLADGDDRIVEQRLAELLKLNAEIGREKKIYRSDSERIQARLMTRPIDSRKAFSYFGLVIGSLPPFALVFKIIGETMPAQRIPILFLTLLAVAGIATGVSGYASGRFVPSLVSRVSQFRLPNRLALISLIGLAWGTVSGALGGLFIFLVGSIFGGIAGGVIGAVTLPILVAFHSALRTGDFIEIKHFLPIAFGITLTLCALILGL